MFEIGTVVQVDGMLGVWRGRVLRHHVTHDGKPSGRTRIEVVDPLAARCCKGQVLDVATLTLWQIR